MEKVFSISLYIGSWKYKSPNSVDKKDYKIKRTCKLYLLWHDLDPICKPTILCFSVKSLEKKTFTQINFLPFIRTLISKVEKYLIENWSNSFEVKIVLWNFKIMI